MKTVSYKYLLPVIVILIWASCKKPYNPIAVGANLNYLVVEGRINTSGLDSTFIKLSRTSNIATAALGKPELKATIKVESDNNASYTLTEKGSGNYFLTPRALGYTQKFRLRIKTFDGKEYLSDYTEAKETPPIENINYTTSTKGVTINVDTHDPANNTRYYRWDYSETWQYHAKYYSYFVSNGTKVVPRDLINNQVYDCWRTTGSNDILLASTIKLSQDIVTAEPITTIDPYSPKITVKYSILLRQYALTAAEFNYWDNIKKNNESLGSIFDSQPSDSPGNIRCISNAGETVIGYVGAGSYTSKRVFINRGEIPIFTYPNEDCLMDTVLFKNPTTGFNDEDLIFNVPKPLQIPLDEYFQGKGNVAGHTGASLDCADCRTKGGVTRKPSFWP